MDRDSIEQTQQYTLEQFGRYVEALGLKFSSFTDDSFDTAFLVIIAGSELDCGRQPLAFFQKVAKDPALFQRIEPSRELMVCFLETHVAPAARCRCGADLTETGPLQNPKLVSIDFHDPSLALKRHLYFQVSCPNCQKTGIAARFFTGGIAQKAVTEEAILEEAIAWCTGRRWDIPPNRGKIRAIWETFQAGRRLYKKPGIDITCELPSAPFTWF